MEDTQQPVSAPSTPSVQPSSPTAPSSSASTPTTDRPSFGEALDTFNSIRSSQGKPTRGQQPGVQPSPNAPAQQVGATIPPADATGDPSQQQSPARAGPVPLDVHTRSLENARQKERQAVEQEYRQRYASLENLMPYAQQFSTDRAAFLATVISEALEDPQLAPQIRSLAGRTLGGSRAGTGLDPTGAAPSPDFQDGQGNQFYSAKAQQGRDEWLIAKVKADILGEVQPQLAQVETVAKREQQREAIQKQTQWRDQTLVKARSLPYFKDHEADIKRVYLGLPQTSGHPAEEAAALREAYDLVVLPKLSQLEHDKAVASMKSRATASTLNPASTSSPGGVPKSVSAKTGGTFRDALRWADAQASGR